MYLYYEFSSSSDKRRVLILSVTGERCAISTGTKMCFLVSDNVLFCFLFFSQIVCNCLIV